MRTLHWRHIKWCSSVGGLPIREHLKLALPPTKHCAWLDLAEHQ
jgi:hypothetical protein